MSEAEEYQKPGAEAGQGGAAVEETAGAEASRSLPLDAVHRRAHASLKERDGWLLPAHYGDAAAEYEAVRDSAHDGGAGLFDLSMRGRVEVSGAEAVQFLNGLITNDVKALAEGEWMTAAFPNVQGRLLASVRVLRRGDAFLFDTEAATHAAVSKTLERFTLAGDFRVRDLTNETALLSVQGAGARSRVGAALGESATSVERGRALETRVGAMPVTLLRATHTGEDGFDLIVSAADAETLWRRLTEAGAQPVGLDAQDVLRVEAGVPRFGADISEANVVLEAVAPDAVSFTKGCYIGQEIIARIHWRGHVAKKLTGLVFDEAADVRAHPSVSSGELKVIAAGEERAVGRATSCVYSPRLERMIALGMIKYDYLAEGTEVRVSASDGARVWRARVAGLPFVRGSWFGPEGGGGRDG
jgi:folate-binding protein YgfZ